MKHDEYLVSETEEMYLMIRRLGALKTTLIGQGGGRGGRGGPRRYGGGRGGRGYIFAQNDEEKGRAPTGTVLVPGTDGRTCNVQCYACQAWGHYADHCPTNQATVLMQLGYNFNQSENGGIPKEWVLLDSCSTDSIFNNCGLLGDIVAGDDSDAIRLNSNGGGYMDAYLHSMLKMFPLKVFYN